MDSKRCDECGFVQSNHTLLWIDGVSSELARRVPLERLPFYGFLMGLAEAIISVLGWVGFHIGRIFGALTLSDDIETAASDRSRLLWLEARKRGIPMQHLLLFGKPTDTFRAAGQFFTSLPLAPRADALRMDDKILFKKTMTAAGLPVPKSYGVTSLRDAEKAFTELSLVCVKPRTGSNGRHTYPYVGTLDELRTAFRNVKQISPAASVEEHLEGNLSRATCVDGKLIGFLESSYPWITGDGTSSIKELVAAANQAKLEGVEDIVLDDSYVGYIKRRGYDLDSVLPEGMRLQLTYRGGSSSGGSNREFGRNIHPSFIGPIEEAARLTNLAIVGFDLIIPDPQASADSQRWGFIEANSLPWIDLHASPYYGEPIDLSAAVWDLWEERNPARGTR